MKLLIHIKSKVQFLRLVTNSFKNEDLKNPVQLDSVHSLAAKPTGMSQP